MPDLSLKMQRGSFAFLLGEEEDETGEVSTVFNFPDGIWNVLQISLNLYPVASPITDAQNFPGKLTWRDKGNVIIDHLRYNYGAIWRTNGLVHVFYPGSDMVVEPGDNIWYQNIDVEGGATMDVEMYVTAQQMR